MEMGNTSKRPNLDKTSEFVTFPRVIWAENRQTSGIFEEKFKK